MRFIAKLTNFMINLHFVYLPDLIHLAIDFSIALETAIVPTVSENENQHLPLNAHPRGAGLDKIQAHVQTTTVVRYFTSATGWASSPSA